jgi:23S rRNA (guanosine2251-2'-O)-methyltransferase
MLIFGVNPVLEALRAGRVTSVTIGARGLRELGAHAKGKVEEVAPSLAPRLGEVARDAAARGLEVRFVDLTEIDRMTRGAVHQGVAAEAGRPRADWTPADLVAAAQGPALIVVLDGIEDPQNFGAILRTAEAAGVDGVIRQDRHSAPMSGTVAKASAGASEHVRVATVVNIARAIEELKAAGVWVTGLAGEGAVAYDAIDYTTPTAIVLGAEGSGLRRLVRERCDHVARIPMAGLVGSLNVSAASAVVLFEVVRQRRQAIAGEPPAPVE